MEAGSAVGEDSPGLRERKKRRTRETIARVAIELFSEHGFHETTIAQIAERADVAPRTVSAYFPDKEQMVFPDVEALFDDLAQRLENRREGEAAMDALRDWILSIVSGEEFELDKARCRRRLVDSDAALRTYERGMQERAEVAIAAAVAVDLGLMPDDLVPRMVGAATIAALDSIGSEAHDPDLEPEDFRRGARIVIDQAMAFLGGGVRSLQRHRGAGR